MKRRALSVLLVAACVPQGDAPTTSTGAVMTTSASATAEPDSGTGDPMNPTSGPTGEPPGTGATTSEPDVTSTGPIATTGTTVTTGTTSTTDTTGTTDAPGTTDATSTGSTGDGTTAADTTGGGDGVTWYSDVLPVAQVRCMGCHRDGGIASFTMEDVAVAQAHAGAMKAATATREMPPWMPDPDCQSFHDERILGDAEIALFAAWADGGALAGDPADAPPPVPPPALAEVDLELAPAAAYTPNKDLDDDYRCLVLDPKHKAPLSLVGLHFLPDQADMVHHVVLFAVDRQTALNKDAQTPGLGWTCFGGPGAPGDALGAWVPGSPPLVYPQGTGLTLDTSDVIVMQMHYNFENIGDSDPLPDLTRVQLQYADGPVVAAKMIPIFDMNFAIPKNAIGYTHGTELTLQQGTRLYGMLPHMHKLGRKISLTSSALGCMIDIPDWDFHWQQFYFFADPQGQLLPAKSKLALQCQWDNPGDQVVTWGEGTADEMCIAYIYTTPP